MSEEAAYHGGCHCGALRLTFRSARPLAPRACGCSFCRKHGGRWVSDAEGSAAIRWNPAVAPTIYRFGTATAEFLICPRCGSCVAAVDEHDTGRIAVLNLNAFDDPRIDIKAAPMDYDGEDVETRQVRRRARWTPIELAAEEASE
jgi:hypothetical protein